jgi:hypothetical protein
MYLLGGFEYRQKLSTFVREDLVRKLSRHSLMLTEHFHDFLQTEKQTYRHLFGGAQFGSRQGTNYPKGVF